MTPLQRLMRQIGNILQKQKALETENEKLRRHIEMLSDVQKTIDNYEKERKERNKKIQALTKKIESLLN